jgi:hypothetical protein
MHAYMKHIKIIYSVALMALLLLSACDQDQDVSPIIKEDDTKARISVNTISNGTSFEEGDVIVLQIKSSRYMKQSVDFTIGLAEGSEANEADFALPESVTLPALTDTVTVRIPITFGTAENTEKAIFTVTAGDPAYNFQIHSSDLTVKSAEFTILNVNPAGVYSIGFEWADSHDDFDMFITMEDGDESSIVEPEGQAATGNNPEVHTGLTPESEDGTYYITIDPYDVGNAQVPYTISIGYENGDADIITGTLDMENLDLEEDPSVGYRIVKIVKSGTTLTVTHLN